MRIRPHFRAALVCGALLFGPGCSVDNKGLAMGTDNASRADASAPDGKATGTGGVVGTGGIVGTGGTLGTGGAIGTGGTLGTGGGLGIGGALGTGGRVGAGSRGNGRRVGDWGAAGAVEPVDEG